MENTAKSSPQGKQKTKKRRRLIRHNSKSEISKLPTSNQKKVKNLQNPIKTKQSIIAARTMRAILLQNITTDTRYPNLAL